MYCVSDSKMLGISTLQFGMVQPIGPERLPVQTYHSESFDCCAVTCVYFIKESISAAYLIVLKRRALHPLWHDLGLVPSSKLQIMKERRAPIFYLLETSFCFSAGLDEK